MRVCRPNDWDDFVSHKIDIMSVCLAPEAPTLTPAFFITWLSAPRTNLPFINGF